MFKKVLFCVLCFSLFSSSIFAEEATEAVKDDYQYFLIEPDIITNYIKPGKRIGFIRITVELVVKSDSDYTLLDRNEPLIRDKIITIFGEQTEEGIKSMVERDKIRQRCIDEVNAVLFAETKKKPVDDMLFTKYLYQ